MSLRTYYGLQLTQNMLTSAFLPCSTTLSRRNLIMRYVLLMHAVFIIVEKHALFLILQQVHLVFQPFHDGPGRVIA